jgi:hypothetical protein
MTAPGVLLTMLLGAVLLTSGCVERSQPVGRNVESLGPLFGGQKLVQEFSASDSTITGVDIRFATYARRNSGTVALQLRRSSTSQESRTATVQAVDLLDGGVFRFRFAPPLGVQAGESLQLELSGDAADPGQGVAVWSMPSEGAGRQAASIEGRPTGLSLDVSPVYGVAWPEAVATSLGDLARGGLTPWAVVLVTFGPGLLLASLLLDRRALGTVGWLSAVPGLGLAVAPLLLLGATVVGFRWIGAAVWIVTIGSFVAAIFNEWRKVLRRGEGDPRLSAGNVAWPHSWDVGLALFAVVLAGLLVRAVALHGSVAPPGADTYHHSLITQLMIDQGSVPSSYQPYAPIDSFAYHFGFHSLAALIGLANGVSGREAVALAAPFANALVAPSFFFLALATGLGPRVGLLSAGVVALVGPYPAALLDLGRAPQADALAIAPMALGLVALLWRSVPARTLNSSWISPRLAIAVGIALAGLFLTHYRIALFLGTMAVLGVVGTGVWLLRTKGQWVRWPRGYLGPAAANVLFAAGIALALVAPWLWRLSQQFTVGIRGSEGRYGPAYFSLDRLGPGVMTPAMVLSLALALIGVVIAYRRKHSIVPLLGVWAAVQLALSNPAWLPLRISGLVDLVTVTSSLFLAVAPAAAVAVEAGYCALVRRQSRMRIAAIGVLSVLATVAALQVPSYVRVSEAPLAKGDVEAAAWVARELPREARIAVNAAVLAWEPDYVTPTDGGYWLPLLSGRPTTLLPVLYPGERGVSTFEIDSMESLARALQLDPASDESRALLKAMGASYIYLGVQGGPIEERKLLDSPHYRTVYRREGVAIFELVDSTPIGSDSWSEGSAS